MLAVRLTLEAWQRIADSWLVWMIQMVGIADSWTQQDVSSTLLRISWMQLNPKIARFTGFRDAICMWAVVECSRSYGLKVIITFK